MNKDITWNELEEISEKLKFKIVRKHEYKRQKEYIKSLEDKLSAIQSAVLSMPPYGKELLLLMDAKKFKDSKREPYACKEEKKNKEERDTPPLDR